LKNKITTIIIVLIMSFVSISYATEVRRMAEISLGGIMFKDKIEILSFQDPDMPFITIYLTTIDTGVPLASDPSNNSVATRLTGKITNIVKTTNQEVINLKKSIGWKTLKIARFYDELNQTMVYVTYSTKMISGSWKHSLSVVPLGEDR